MGEKVGSPNLFPGIKQLVRLLSQHANLYVVTASQTDKVSANLTRLGIRKYFVDISGQEKVPHLKKHEAEFVLTPLRRWGVDPTKALTIGDTRDEIKAGKEAGLRTIACAWGWNTLAMLMQEKPDLIVRSPKGLATGIKRMALRSARPKLMSNHPKPRKQRATRSGHHDADKQ